MSRRDATGGSALAGFGAAGFALAFFALVSSQLALMSVLDADRASRAAEQIAESRFTASVVEQTVVRAVSPIAGDELAQVAADGASSDPNVVRVVESSLLEAHRQIVDPDAPARTEDPNERVGSAIITSVIDTAAANGIDLVALGVVDEQGNSITGVDAATIAADAGLPEIVPENLPRLGLRDVAETTRVVSLIAMVLFAMIALFAHPRPGRSLRGLGTRVAVVTGLWLLAMLFTGWIIGLFADTLFGEMIDTVWSDAVPSMILLVIGGVVIGIAFVLGGVALDGFDRDRTRPVPPPRGNSYGF